jgi:hypothetical protein
MTYPVPPSALVPLRPLPASLTDPDTRDHPNRGSVGEVSTYFTFDRTRRGSRQAGDQRGQSQSAQSLPLR